MAEIDVIVRVAGGAVFLLLAAGMVSTRPTEPGAAQRAWLFALLALGAVGFLSRNTPDPALMVEGAAAAVLSLFSGTAALFLWWLGLAFFDDEFRLGPVHLGVGAVWVGLALADRGFLGPALADIGLSWPLIAIAIGMIAHLFIRLLADRDGDLLAGRREARLVLVAVLTLILLVDVLADVLFGLAWRPRAFALAQNIAIMSVGLWLFIRLFKMQPAALAFAPPQPVPLPAAQTTGQDRQLMRVTALIEAERLHLDPEMSLAEFARRAGLSVQSLRSLIHDRLGHHHFRTFLNAHRVEEAKRRLADPAQGQEKIAAIAHDSGFASLASFNRAFKALEGITPSAWRARALGASDAAAELSRSDAEAFEK